MVDSYEKKSVGYSCLVQSVPCQDARRMLLGSVGVGDFVGDGVGDGVGDVVGVRGRRSK